MSACPRIGKLFGGCAFEGRFDKSEPKINGEFNYSGLRGAERLDQLRQITYVRDVCIRCGKTIERGASTATQ